MWKYKKNCETIQVIKARKKECVLSLAAERMCPTFRVCWFCNWSGSRIKTSTYADKLDGFLVFFFYCNIFDV